MSSSGKQRQSEEREREIDGPRDGKVFRLHFSSALYEQRAAEYKVEPLPLVRKSFTSSLLPRNGKRLRIIDPREQPVERSRQWKIQPPLVRPLRLLSTAGRYLLLITTTCTRETNGKENGGRRRRKRRRERKERRKFRRSRGEVTRLSRIADGHRDILISPRVSRGHQKHDFRS